MRYSEEQAKAPTDFLPRDRFTAILQFVTIFFVCYATLIAYFTFMGASINDSVFNPLSAFFILVFSGVITYIMNYNRDVLLATEFQNAIFASAISRNYMFSIISRADGSIMFADQGVQESVADYSRILHTNMEDIYDLSEISEEHRQAIRASIKNQQKESLILNMKMRDNTRKDMVVSIEPLTKTNQFSLVRARPYWSKRGGEVVQAEREAKEQARSAQPQQAAAEQPVVKAANMTPEVKLPAMPDAGGAQISNAQIAGLFEEAPIAIVRCNLGGDIIHVNKAFDELIRIDESSRPVHILDLVAPEKKDETSASLSQLFDRDAQARHVDVEFILPNSDSISVSIFANQSTENDLVTFYLIDVSEQKNLELRFAHSQKMQAVGQLAGGVAHDFNNLLTAMIGFCDLLLMRHPAGDQSFADIMQVKQNANRAANLVRQLLAFSRRQTLQAKNIDVTELLAELSNLIRRLIGENIELKMIHGRDLSMVKADQGQLEQVVINLAVNARDAMPDGGVLTIRSSNMTVDRAHPLPSQMLAPVGEDVAIPSGNYVLIEVSDSGTGIPKDVMPKIFEPFFSTKEIGSGTGLGLATVYGIIKQTGGYIFVNSSEGQGTQFHIYFPALSAQEEKIAEAETVEQNAQDLTGRDTILLVEDETPVRAFASRALKNKGYTVIEADCGESGLDHMQEHGSTIDLIITDVIMPGINGPTMVEKISSSYPDIKVIFMSGYAEDIFMNNYGSERSFNFLSKPFTLKQLAAKVKEVLTS